MNISIIGAGQIGSRHLQGVALLETPVNVQIVDPSEKSISTACERFNDLYSGDVEINLTSHNLIDELPKEIDIAIISTSSDIRMKVLEELIEKKNVKKLILEKVLFQKLSDYDRCSKLITSKSIPTWVNCYLRNVEFIQNIKECLSINSDFKMKVEGSNWGLGCIGVHYLDLFAYLTEDPDLVVNSTALDINIHDAKRSGHKEFTGVIEGQNSVGSFTLQSSSEGNRPLTITIFNGDETHEICEYLDYQLRYSFSLGDKTEVSEETIPFQSQMTKTIIEDLIDTNSCKLSDYETSKQIHLPLIKSLLNHYNNQTGEKTELCPIT